MQPQTSWFQRYSRPLLVLVCPAAWLVWHSARVHFSREPRKIRIQSSKAVLRQYLGKSKQSSNRVHAKLGTPLCADGKRGPKLSFGGRTCSHGCWTPRHIMKEVNPQYAFYQALL